MIFITPKKNNMDNTHSNKEENGNNEWKNREMGALWMKDGKSQKFYSGFIKLNKGTDQEQEVHLVIFKNKFKQESAKNAPDLIIYQSEEQKKALDHDSLPETFI